LLLHLRLRRSLMQWLVLLMLLTLLL